MDAATVSVPVICLTLGAVLAWGRCSALAVGVLSLAVIAVTSLQLSPPAGAVGWLVAMAEAAVIQASYFSALAAITLRDQRGPHCVSTQAAQPEQ